MSPYAGIVPIRSISSLEEPALPLALLRLIGATASTLSFSCAHFLRSFTVRELPTSCRQT